MNEKIQVLDVSIDNYTAKEAMKKVVEYMKTEPVNVIEMVTMNTLMKLFEKEEHKKYISEFDLTFSGTRALLEAAGVTDSVYLKEADNMLFLKMIMRFFHKNHHKVFLLAENKDALKELREYLESNYTGIRIVETASMEEHGKSDDMILNRVNGAEAECIISILPSPLQEQFIVRNRSLLNVKLWFGLGNEPREKRKASGKSRLKAFFERRSLKKEIEKERRKAESCEECIEQK